MEATEFQPDETLHTKSLGASTLDAASDEAGRWNREVRVFVVLGFVVIGSLITIAGLLILSGRDSEGLTTVGGPGREEPAQTDPNNIGEDLVTLIPVVRTVRPTTAERTMSTRSTASMRTTSPTSPTSATSPVGNVTRAVPLPNDFLVCTVNGEGPSLATIMPAWSQCNIIFLDSKGKVMSRENVETFNENEQAFLNWPNTYPNGQFGMSFSVADFSLATSLDTSNFSSTIKDLFQKGIRHTAVINMDWNTPTEIDLTVALRALRTAYEVLLEYNSTTPSYFVLGMAIDDPAVYGIVGLMRVHFVPSLFISIAHTTYDDRFYYDCRILPPTWLTIPPGFRPENITYGRSLAQSCNLLLEVARAGIQVPTAIGFTLSGHMYKPRFRDPAVPLNEEYELFGPCENFAGDFFVSPAELCSPNSEMFDRFRKSRESDVLFTFDTGAERTLTFDDDETIRNKVCETRNTCQGATFGVAAYDIEYDASQTTCPRFGLTGSFGRVAFLTNMNRYLKSLTPANPFSKSRCLSVTSSSTNASGKISAAKK